MKIVYGMIDSQTLYVMYIRTYNGSKRYNLPGNSNGDVYRLQAINDYVVLGHGIRMQVEQQREWGPIEIKGGSLLDPGP